VVLEVLRRERLPWVLTAGQAGLLVLGFALQTRSAWLACLFACLGLGLWGWLRALNISRAIRDTPTSRISSAAQGYVELNGIARPLPDTTLVSPVTSLPCLWYSYRAERRVGDKWVHEEDGRSDLDFILDDGTGHCQICLQGAEISTTHRENRQIGDLRYTEDVLLKDDQLYALGDFVSENGADQDMDLRRDTGELLAEWKTDQDALRARFDLNGDHAVDQDEWRHALDAAREEVERKYQALRDQPAHHFLRRPDNGMPFIIANMPQEGLEQRHLTQARLHLLSLTAAFVGLVWISRWPS
jgi:hypothetical protein